LEVLIRFGNFLGKVSVGPLLLNAIFPPDLRYLLLRAFLVFDLSEVGHLLVQDLG
jgi:hypothetical protein